MAKNNNLKDFLTGVADAIRTKKGTTDLINPQDFDSEISSISTEKPEQEKTVNLNMAEGNQVIEPEVGNVLSKVTVNKPDTLIPNNIKEGVSIGGVEGTFVGKKPEQEKSITVTENGTQEVTPDEGKVLSKVTVVTEIETGGGGNQPIMNAPTVSLSGRQLTMTNPSTNGNFFSKFKVFVDNTLKTEQTETTIDLYEYFDKDGTYNLAAKCAGTYFQDSALSGTVSYTKFTPTGAVQWYGNATPLSTARDILAATTIGDYALFGGGRNSSGYGCNVVDAYDTSLTRTIPTELSFGNYGLGATTVGNYALFAYGSNVNAYDVSLTRTILAESSVSLINSAATTVGNYALFASGTSINAYDVSLTSTIPTELSVARSKMAATTVGDYALFAGGYTFSGMTENYYATVDAYDTSLTRTIPTELSTKSGRFAATTVGNYALFGGGTYYSGSWYIRKAVDAYDTSLTRTIPTELSVARGDLSSTTVGNYALFGGGEDNSSTQFAVVEAYDVSLTMTIPEQLSTARRALAATTVGNYALFGGGYSSSYFDVVDVYTVQ